MINKSKTMCNSTVELSNIVDLDVGKNALQEILNAHFQSLYGYSNIAIVWSMAQGRMFLFLNDNAINTPEELWDFMFTIFSPKYVMKYPHIWKVLHDFPSTAIGIIINLARQFDGVLTRDQVVEYFAKINQTEPDNATIISKGTFVLYDDNQYVLTEALNLSDDRIEAIKMALDKILKDEEVEYIVLRDLSVEWFAIYLPPLNSDIKWTPLLLQEMIRLSPNVGYRVIFTGLKNQALDTVGVALVPSNSEIVVFADIVHRYCFENKMLGKKLTAEKLRTIIRDAKMIHGKELIYNLHKVLNDYRFAFTDQNRVVKILEKR
ncbi:MAG: hypothetical protein LBE09_01630 [Christensenellaceae bacterium]|jgi:hypothetical protein|nr:hypothetical protein [Christensenellaceae bacterium]